MNLSLNAVAVLVEWLAACMTGLAAVLASYNVSRQIQISNRQFLFDRRIAAYRTIQELVGVFQKNVELLKENDSSPYAGFSAEFRFRLLVNSPMWANIPVNDIVKAGNGPKTQFLLKCEELKTLADSLVFLFPKQNMVELFDFINQYVSILSTLQGYCIQVDLMRDENEKLEIMSGTLLPIKDALADLLKREQYFEKITQMESFASSNKYQITLSHIKQELKLEQERKHLNWLKFWD